MLKSQANSVPWGWGAITNDIIHTLSTFFFSLFTFKCVPYFSSHTHMPTSLTAHTLPCPSLLFFFISASFYSVDSGSMFYKSPRNILSIHSYVLWTTVEVCVEKACWNLLKQNQIILIWNDITLTQWLYELKTRAQVIRYNGCPIVGLSENPLRVHY